MTRSPVPTFLLVLSAGLLLAAMVQAMRGLPCMAQLGAGMVGFGLVTLRRHL